MELVMWTRMASNPTFSCLRVWSIQPRPEAIIIIDSFEGACMIDLRGLGMTVKV